METDSNQNYSVTLVIYSETEIKRDFFNYAEARAFAQGLSLFASHKWTRHCNCKGLVEHYDSYYDLYNEGGIVIENKMGA